MFRLTAAQTLVGRQRAKEAPSEVPLLEKADVQLEGLRSSLTHAQDELRAALWTMKEEAEGPAAMSDLFRYAAARLPQWEGIVRFVTEGEEKAISRRYAGVLLMILQEAVGNALRHGRATAVTVKFVFGRKGVAMLVEDNGCGVFAEEPGRPSPGGGDPHRRAKRVRLPVRFLRAAHGRSLRPRAHGASVCRCWQDAGGNRHHSRLQLGDREVASSLDHAQARHDEHDVLRRLRLRLGPAEGLTSPSTFETPSTSATFHLGDSVPAGDVVEWRHETKRKCAALNAGCR